MPDPAQLSQYVTLLFIGTISALCIRAFLRNARQVFAAFARVQVGLQGLWECWCRMAM